MSARNVIVASTDRFFVLNKINLSPNWLTSGVRNSSAQEGESEETSSKSISIDSPGLSIASVVENPPKASLPACLEERDEPNCFNLICMFYDGLIFNKG